MRRATVGSSFVCSAWAKILPSTRFSSSSTAPSRSASCSSLSSSAASSRRSLLKILMEAIVKSRWLREPLAKTPFEWLCVAAYPRSIKLDNWLRQLWDRLWILRLLTDFAVRPGGNRLSFRKMKNWPSRTVDALWRTGHDPPALTWAHQDSNLEPKDSRCPMLSHRRGLSHHPQPALVGCGRLWPVIKGTSAPR